MLESVNSAMDGFDDPVFGHYNLTRFFVAHAVAQIFKDDPSTKVIFQDPAKLFVENKIPDFMVLFQNVAATTVDDLNAEVSELMEKNEFDHKRDLKSPVWCRNMSKRLVSAYSKDVKRKRVQPVFELFEAILG